MTTASQANALAAHGLGSPDCGGQLEMIADFTRPAAVMGATGRRRRRETSGSGHDVRGIRTQQDPGLRPPGA